MASRLLQNPGHLVFCNNSISLVTNPISLVTNPISLVTNPISLVINPISLMTNPISLVTNPISLMTNPISLVTNSFANLQPQLHCMIETHSIWVYVGLDFWSTLSYCIIMAMSMWQLSQEDEVSDSLCVCVCA